MSDPRYAIDRTVAAPPETVLAALRDAAATTPRAALPPAQQRGVRGLTGTVRGRRFTVALDQPSDGDLTRLHGWVLPEEGTGSRVQASVQDDDRNAGTVVLGMIALAGFFAYRGDGLAWGLVALAALLGIVAGIRRIRGSINHELAAFLVRWLHGVLDRLPSAPAEPATPPHAAADDASES